MIARPRLLCANGKAYKNIGRLQGFCFIFSICFLFKTYYDSTTTKASSPGKNETAVKTAGDRRIGAFSMERNASCFLWDNVLANSTYWVATGTVVASLMDYYRLSPALTNLIVGLTATLPVLQMLGAKWYAGSAGRHRLVVLLSLAWRFLLPMAFFTVLLPAGLGGFAAPVFYLLAQAAYQLVSPIQSDWMVNRIGKTIKSNYYSVREAWLILAMTISVCAVNMMLDRGQTQGNMRQMLFCAALYLSLPLAASDIPLLRADPPLPGPQKSGSLFGTAFRDRGFRPILLVGGLWAFAGMFNGSFAATYQVSVLHLPYRTILLWAVAANLARTAATMGMAALADRFGWRFVCTGCMALIALSGITWFCIDFCGVHPLYELSCLLPAIGYAGLGVGFFRYQLAGMPPANQSAYFSAGAVLSGAAATLGSLGCSALIGLFSAWQFPVSRIFLLGAALGLASAFAMFNVRRQPGAAVSCSGAYEAESSQ
jgi:hypothetical protein